MGSFVWSAKLLTYPTLTRALKHSTYRCVAVSDEAKRRVDPTNTAPERRRFEADLLRRFGRLKRQVVEAVVKQDVLGIGGETRDSLTFERVFADELPATGQFDFPRSSTKVKAFMGWLKRQQDAGILEVTRGVPARRAAEQAWTNVYVRGAYLKGLEQADGALKRIGNPNRPTISSAFMRPVHADRVGLVYTRVFTGLKNITTKMDERISATLARGLAEGKNPTAVARMLVANIDGIGIARARTLARTEIIAAHAEATLNSYEEAGITGVSVEAEWSTAGDDAVCAECSDHEGETVSIDDARDQIPAHPNCRCAWLPIVGEPSA